MPFDLTSMDIRRFGRWAGDPSFLRSRVSEALGLHYQMAWPNREFVTGRGRRLSPLHGLLARQGACFGVKGGWERPNWFARVGGGCSEEPKVVYGFGRQNWFANHAFEHRACRERVALFDQSGFAKLWLRGPAALQVLERLATNRMDVAVGRIVYTGLLNARGGYESDVTVARLASDSFLVITGSAQGVRDADWIRRKAPEADSCELTDVTEETAVIGVMGPRARDLLARCTRHDLSDKAFPFGVHQCLRLGGAEVLAMRVSYVGELGWELYVPAALAESVYVELSDAGADLGVANAGHYAIQSLRIEKGYRAFGAEQSADESPLEAGLGFTVDWEKPGGFLGLEALVQRRELGLKKRLAFFAVEDPEVMLWGGEPVFRNGDAVGYTTSAAYGHTVGAAVALAYVRCPSRGVVGLEWVQEGRYEILSQGVRVPARVSARPLLGKG